MLEGTDKNQYLKRKDLKKLISDLIYENEKNSRLMIYILSHIVENCNGESGLHVLHIHTLTRILLEQLTQKTDRYSLTMKDKRLISMASGLHDIGKLFVPGSILNKPGKLTPEEFEIIKSHSEAGASVIEKIPLYQEEPLMKYAYEICRWHHERYDGKGYPDGLAGEEIPISAQIVSVADAYDALISKRVYKEAFSHEIAMKMILNGECGAFNPLLLECLTGAGGSIKEELEGEIIYQQIKPHG